MSLVGRVARNHVQQAVDDGVDDRGTPPDFFEELSVRFGGFTVDAAAAPHNTKLPRYWSRSEDGLTQSWDGERIWCNPPYSRIWPWVRKANQSRAALVVMLLPANRTEQRWWQLEVEPIRDRAGSRLTVEFLPGRLRFIMPDGIQTIGRPPFGCCLLIWRAHPSEVPYDPPDRDVARWAHADLPDAPPLVPLSDR